MRGGCCGQHGLSCDGWLNPQLTCRRACHLPSGAGISSSTVPILVSVAGTASGANITVRKPDGIAAGVAATYGERGSESTCDTPVMALLGGAQQ